MAQGVISNLWGGSFKSGFIGGVIGKASGVATNDIGGASPIAITLRTVTAAVFGGLASEATGGSFADGALSAALTHLFNDENLFNIFKENDMWASAARRLSLSEGDEVFDIYTHGNSQGIMNASKFINVQEAVGLIQKSSGYKPGMAVKLWACNTGSGQNSFAQQLANILNTVVIAPDQLVMYTLGNKTAPLTLASRSYKVLYYEHDIISYHKYILIYTPEGNWRVFFNPNNKSLK